MASNTFKSIPSLKLTLMGDGGVGKSCLILQYMYADFSEEYEPTKADAFRKTITLQGDEVQIDILDTAGQEDYPVVRDGYIKHGDGFLLVFDLTNPKTLDSIKNMRENILRVKEEVKHLPMILIGNKCDLTSSRKIAYEEANQLAERWKCAYIEVSAKTRENVDKSFSEIFLHIKDIVEMRRAKVIPTPVKTLSPVEEKAVRADHNKKRGLRKYCTLM